MVSTRGVRYKFSEGERVLCYEPDPTKAKVLYDSKVLEVIESKDKRGRRTMEYLIHFQGWNSSWDRCVSEDFVLKDTEENRQLQRDLAEKSQLQLGAYLYRRERKKGSSASAGAGPAKRPRHGFSDDGSSTSTQPDEGETAGDTDSSAGSRASQAPTPPPLPQLGRAQITLPPTLRDLLTFDYHLVVKRGRLSALPASPSAADILESFVKWFARSGAWRQRARPDPPHRPDLADVCCRLNLVREVADGLRVYFDFILRGHLLYKQEATQYEEVCGKYEPKEEDPAPEPEENHKEEVIPPIAELDIKSPKIPEYAHLPPDPTDPTDVADNHDGSQPNEKPVVQIEHNDTNETIQHKVIEDKAIKDETPQEKTPNDKANKDKILNDKPPKDKTNKKSSCEKAPNDRIPNDKSVREKPPNEKSAKEKPMNDKTPNDKVVKDKPNDKAAKDKAPIDRAAKENTTKVKTHSEKTAKEKPTSDKLNDKTANDKTPSEKTLRDKTANDKMPTEKSSNDKLATTDKNIPEDANHSGVMTARESRCATRSENLARRLRSQKSVAPETEGEPEASTSTLKPTSLPGPSSAVATSTSMSVVASASASAPAAAVAAGAVLPGEPRIFETLSSSVCSSESSVSSGWAARRAAAAAAAPVASQLTRTPLSVLLDKVAKWQIIPREGTENLPCRVYGAIHLARLFVKLPDFLNATQIPDIKLKLILKHIDMFVQYLEEHNEWFGEMYYIADTASRSR